MSLIKQLREVGSILGLNCGDNSCMFSERSGAGTNGGCQCDLVEAVKALKERERLVQAVVTAFRSWNFEHGSEAYFHAACFALAEADNSSPRSVQVGKRPSRPAARVRDPKSKGGDSARREEASFLPAAEPDATQTLESERAHRAADVFGAHDNLTLMVGAETPVDIVPTDDVRVCDICGRACAKPSQEHAEVMRRDGREWFVVHDECLREAMKKVVKP